jgi:hypothetical protein
MLRFEQQPVQRLTSPWLINARSILQTVQTRRETHFRTNKIG